MLLSAVTKCSLVDYPGYLAAIAFTPGCNFRCGFCHNPDFVLSDRVERMRPSFIPDLAFFRFLEERQGFLDAVSICGGEPTIHAELPDFIARIRDMGYRVKLDTNGSNPDMLARLFRDRLLDYVAMDVKCLPEEYPEVLGARMKPEAIRESIGLLLGAEIECEFRTTVHLPFHSLSRMEAIGNLVRGTKKYALQAYRPGKTLDPSFNGRIPTGLELEAIRSVLLQHVHSVEIRT